MRGVTNLLNRDLERRLHRRKADLMRWAEEQRSPEDEALNELEQLTSVTPAPTSAPAESLDAIYQRFRHLSRELANRHLTDNQLQDTTTVRSWYSVTEGIAEKVSAVLEELKAAIDSGVTAQPKQAEE